MFLKWNWTVGVLAIAAALMGGCAHRPPSYESVNQGLKPGTGFLKEEARVQGGPRDWPIFVPNDYTPEKKLPAIVYLHGFMAGGSGGASAVDSGIGPYIVKRKES